MPRQSHYRRSVKFFDDSQASETDDHHQIQAAASTKTDQNISSKYEGPRFPNLHMMFKNKETATTQRDHPVVVERSVETVEKTCSHEEKNIDKEAEEYIKRKRQYYYERLKSMNV